MKRKFLYTYQWTGRHEKTGFGMAEVYMENLTYEEIVKVQKELTETVHVMQLVCINIVELEQP